MKKIMAFVMIALSILGGFAVVITTAVTAIAGTVAIVAVAGALSAPSVHADTCGPYPKPPC